jgi:hypothetical protein
MFIKSMLAAVLALPVSMVHVPQLVLTKSTTLILVVSSSMPLNTMPLRQSSCDYHLNHWLEDFVASYEFKVEAEIFVDVVEDNNKDLHYQDVFLILISKL